MSIRTRIAAGALTVSVAGLAFLAGNEGISYQAIPDPLLGWSVPTICHGHTGPDVHRGLVADKAMCSAWLSQDAQKALEAVARCVTYRPLTQNEVDALVSFTVNVGGPKMCHSTLVKLLNRGDVQGAASQFTRWSYSGGKWSKGLYERRRREANLFSTPDTP